MAMGLPGKRQAEDNDVGPIPGDEASRSAGEAWGGPQAEVLRDRPDIELQLAHAPRNAVSASYNHALYLEPRAKLMQDWADWLDRTRQNVRTMPARERTA